MARKKYHVISTIRDKRGRVLSVGYNSYSRTHPLQAKLAEACGLPEKIYLHAEISSILKLKGKALQRAHSITVERYDSEGNPANASPCPICAKAIDAVGISVVHHT